jgi:hypothetical protein
MRKRRDRKLIGAGRFNGRQSRMMRNRRKIRKKMRKLEDEEAEG